LSKAGWRAFRDFGVLVIPEDPTYNGHILKPLCERLLEAAGKPRANIKILTDPKVSGDADAKAKILSEIPEAWDHMDLLLFIRDADGKDRSAEFARLDQHGNPATPGGGRRFLMQQALANYDGIKQRCPELQVLENRIREFVSNLT
jgi:hypothetical protein